MKQIARDRIKILVWTLSTVAVLTLLIMPLSLARRAGDWVNPSTVFAQEKSNTFYALQFSGADMYTKIGNAQNSCTQPASFNMNCVIVIDSILAGWPQGTVIQPCGNCIWLDYSQVTFLNIHYAGSLCLSTTTTVCDGNLSAGSIVFSGTLLPQTAGGGSIGSTTKPIGNGIFIGSGVNLTNKILTTTTTANRTFTLPDGNSQSVMVGTLTTGAGTTDNVAIQGVTASSHCALFPTNSGAANEAASTFISAKAANQITVTHLVNAGFTWDVLCTSN